MHRIYVGGVRRDGGGRVSKDAKYQRNHPWLGLEYDATEHCSCAMRKAIRRLPA